MFLETPRFPRPPSLGYRSRPLYSVTSIERAGGHVRTNLNWSAPLHEFHCEIEHAEEDIYEVLEFWHAVGGMAYKFRFQDWHDYKSCAPHEAVAATDQPLLLVTAGSPTEYQLVKRYIKGLLTRDRPILKPVTGTILVADNGITKVQGTDYSVDHTRGRVSLNFAPIGPLTWGGEFDVPVRFASDLEIELTFRGDDSTRVQRVPFVLREDRTG